MYPESPKGKLRLWCCPGMALIAPPAHFLFIAAARLMKAKNVMFSMPRKKFCRKACEFRGMKRTFGSRP